MASTILPRSVGAFFRLGTGMFAEGYSASLTSNKVEGTYYGVGATGQYLQESADPLSDKLKVPIQLYEFETCPYCKKVSQRREVKEITRV